MLLKLFTFLILFYNSSSAIAANSLSNEEGIFELSPESTTQNTVFHNSNDEIRFNGFESELRKTAQHVERLENIIAQLRDQLAAIEDHLANKNNVATITSTVKVPPKTVDTQDFKDDDKERISYDKALSDFKDSQYQDAELKFELFIKKYPNSPLLSNAYFWYGESFYRRNYFDKAALYFLKGYKCNVKGSKAADLLLKLALSLGEIDKFKEACASLTKLDKEFPERANISKKTAQDAKVKFGCSNISTN